MRFLLFLIFWLSASILTSDKEEIKEVQVTLKSPTYCEGTLSTDEGGVLTKKGIRIQATKIIYEKKEGQKHSVIASGNLMVRYGDKCFVGEKIEYDFLNQSGTIYKARTHIGQWYIQSRKIELLPNHSYKLYRSSLSTCSSLKALWQIRVPKGEITDGDLLSAYNAQVRFLYLPIFWYPYLQARISTLRDIPAFYSFTTGDPLQKRISMRYLAYANYGVKAYLQLDYWFKKGPSGSAQIYYIPDYAPVIFKSHSFLAYDQQATRSPSGAPPVNMFRNRFEGILDATISKKLRVQGQYERLSDAFVYETYFNRYYFLFLAKHTQLVLSMNEDLWKGFLRAKVRLNQFQTVDQELPLLFFNLRPLQVGKTGFIFDFTGNVGYLDYVYGSDISQRFANFRSSRLEVKPRLSYPIQFCGLKLNPQASYIGIGYGQSPKDRVEWNTLCLLKCSLNYQLSKVYGTSLKHTIEPYCHYTFMSKPTTPFNDLYFFNIQDAYAKLNELRFGLKSALYKKYEQKMSAPITVDLYSMGLFNNTTIGSFIPRVFAEITQRLPFAYTSFNFAYNLQHNVIDQANARTAITFSEKLAISFLFMHRSKYFYRKANLDSYLLNVFRSQADLLASPLSDRRNIAQTKIYWRIFRDLIFEFESRSGWNRVNSPPFNEMWFNMVVLLPCNWRLTFSPQRTVNPAKGSKYIWLFKFNLQLGGQPPTKMSEPHIFW